VGGYKTDVTLRLPGAAGVKAGRWRCSAARGRSWLMCVGRECRDGVECVEGSPAGCGKASASVGGVGEKTYFLLGRGSRGFTTGVIRGETGDDDMPRTPDRNDCCRAIRWSDKIRWDN
jgi:hypothetical protein